jgi:hypothetical protein
MGIVAFLDVLADRATFCPGEFPMTASTEYVEAAVSLQRSSTFVGSPPSTYFPNSPAQLNKLSFVKPNETVKI